MGLTVRIPHFCAVAVALMAACGTLEAAAPATRARPNIVLILADDMGYARPWASVSNTPWRAHKITAYEGGISTPLVAHWPAGIPKEAHGRLVREPRAIAPFERASGNW